MRTGGNAKTVRLGETRGMGLITGPASCRSPDESSLSFERSLSRRSLYPATFAGLFRKTGSLIHQRSLRPRHHTLRRKAARLLVVEPTADDLPPSRRAIQEPVDCGAWISRVLRYPRRLAR